jgi:predicted Zn-dependent peptidase
MPTVQKTILDSGLTILTETMSGVETVSFGAYIDAGSRHESQEENGAAHFLEHMAFKGTGQRSSYQIAESIEGVGGEINAHTSREQTAYYVKLLKEDLAIGVEIIGDILTDSQFDPDEVEKERNVILQEIAQTNDTPDELIFDLFQSAAFPDQPLGRPILGSEDIVSRMKSSTLKTFIQTHYQPKNMVVTASGNLTHEHVVDLVAKSFSGLSNYGPAPALVPGTYVGGIYAEYRNIEQVHTVIGFQAPGYGAADYYPALLLSVLLGGGMSSRLFQEVREKRGLAYEIGSFVWPSKDTGLFGIMADTSPNDVPALMEVLVEELWKTQDEITQQEMRRAKAQFKATLLMSMESTSIRCEQMAWQWQNFGRIISVPEMVANIDAITADEVMMTAYDLFTTKKTVTVLGPIDKPRRIGAVIRDLSLS